jgi:hypothetical protein
LPSLSSVPTIVGSQVIKSVADSPVSLSNASDSTTGGDGGSSVNSSETQALLELAPALAS